MRAAGRFSSPAVGSLARSRSRRASISAATASSRARKGLFLPLILGIAPLSLALRLLYQVLYLSDNQSPARNAIEGPSVAQEIIGSMVLAIWLYLIAARGGFLRAAERYDARLPA